MRSITLVYDGGSTLAPSTRLWLESEPKYVPVHVSSARMLELAGGLPGLDPASLAERLTAIDDEGGVWRDGAAELLVLWALRRYRARALAIRDPSRLPFRRGNLNWVAGGSGEAWRQHERAG